MKKFLFLVLVSLSLFSCQTKSEVDETETYTLNFIDSTFMDKVETEKIITPPTVAKEVRYWSATETGLPKGVVYTSDCFSRGTSEQKIKDNYVTIKRPNGYLTIVKDIDEDLFLNLHDGDIIE